MALCPRHRLVARFEHGLCGQCFREATQRAEAEAIEKVIARIRWRVRGEFGKR